MGGLSCYSKPLGCLTAPPGELYPQRLYHWDNQLPGLNSPPPVLQGLFSCVNPKWVPSSFNHAVVTASSPVS